MANFDKYYPTLLQHEGTGYHFDPDDPGKHTHTGITYQTFEAVAHELGVVPLLDSFKELTPEQIKYIYRKHYWDAIQGDLIPSQTFAEFYFDFFVNAGFKATKVLQQTINILRPVYSYTALKVDGIFGPLTLHAVLDLLGIYITASSLYTAFVQRRLDYYRDIVRANPRLAKYSNGWGNRVRSFPEKLAESDFIPVEIKKEMTARQLVIFETAMLTYMAYQVERDSDVKVLEQLIKDAVPFAEQLALEL